MAMFTHTTMKNTIKSGKINNNVGFPRGMSGITRQLTQKELAQQLALQRGRK
jgi:hypothetical protein